VTDLDRTTAPGAPTPRAAAPAPRAGADQTALTHLTVDELAHRTDAARGFADRHIGPRGTDTASMLEQLGYDSLDDLVDAAVPASIRTDRPLALPDAKSGFGPEALSLEKKPARLEVQSQGRGSGYPLGKVMIVTPGTKLMIETRPFVMMAPFSRIVP